MSGEDSPQNEGPIKAFVDRHKMLVGIVAIFLAGGYCVQYVDVPDRVVALEDRHEDDVDSIFGQLEEIGGDVKDVKALICIDTRERVGRTARECIDDS